MYHLPLLAINVLRFILGELGDLDFANADWLIVQTILLDLW